MFHKYMSKAYIVAFIILVVCLLPGSALPSPEIDWVSFDKFVHLVMYVPLAWTIFYGFNNQSKYSISKRKSLMFTFVIALFYGALIELLQFAITPDRAAELWDFVADVVGVVLGLLTLKIGERLILFWNKIFRIS